MNEISHKYEGLEDKPPTPNKKWERVEYSQNDEEINSFSVVLRRMNPLFLGKEMIPAIEIPPEYSGGIFCASKRFDFCRK
jgi:hypothetical protein